MDTVPDQEVIKSWFEEKFYAMSESVDPETRKAYDELKDRILAGVDTSEAEQEDDNWEEDMKAELESQNKPEAAVKPNLLDDTPDNYQVSGDDLFVPD